MLRGMTHTQFLEWHAFSELEPFDAERDDLRIASIVQVLMNINRDRKRKTVPFTIDEAVLKFGDTPARERPQQSWQSMKMLGRMMASAYNYTDKQKRKAA
jgi:hypothetical protein